MCVSSACPSVVVTGIRAAGIGLSDAGGQIVAVLAGAGKEFDSDVRHHDPVVHRQNIGTPSKIDSPSRPSILLHSGAHTVVEYLRTRTDNHDSAGIYIAGRRRRATGRQDLVVADDGAITLNVNPNIRILIDAQVFGDVALGHAV